MHGIYECFKKISKNVNIERSLVSFQLAKFPLSSLVAFQEAGREEKDRITNIVPLCPCGHSLHVLPLCSHLWPRPLRANFACNWPFSSLYPFIPCYSSAFLVQNKGECQQILWHFWPYPLPFPFHWSHIRPRPLPLCFCWPYHCWP